MPDPTLPPAVAKVAALDPGLAAELEEAFGRLVRAGDALAWAQERLPAIIEAGSPSGVLGLLVDEARELTGAPSVWALSWRGDPTAGPVSFDALAAAGETGEVPGPGEISRTIVGRVAADGRPAWSDDARADARFQASQSVQAFTLRSVGCVPVGPRGVLYLLDPEQPGRFGLGARLRITALCSLAGPFLAPTRPVRRRRPSDAVGGLVGESPVMLDLYDAIRAFAPMPWPALIVGETGTGKELVARAMHDLSARAEGPFVAVNCGAIPAELAESTLFGHERGAFTGADRRKEGLVERVRGGTLFLDEVGELAPALQVKLLRLLQEGAYERVGGEREHRFDGRVLAATLRPLDDPGDRGAFREDLYHRLAAAVIRVPALRERRDDIGILALHLLARALEELPNAPRLGLGAAAEGVLRARTWSGNVRELENTLRSAVARALAARSPVIEPEHLAPERRPSREDVDLGAITDLQAATDAFQERVVRAALDATGGNRTQAAKRLGVTRQWLHRLLSRWES